MMKRVIGTAVVLLAVLPAVSSASAAPTKSGSLSFVDYTPDATTLAAVESLHVVTGAHITSYCDGSRMPSAPQDVNARQLKVSKRSTIRLTMSTTGVWGLDLATSRGQTLTGIATTPGAPTVVTVRVAPGTYAVKACNLVGGTAATVTYQLTSSR